MVRKQLRNGSQTECAYVWTGLWTCAAPFTNGSHTIRHEPKFVEDWVRRVSFPFTGCPLLVSGLRKINYQGAAYVLHMNSAVRKQRTRVYKAQDFTLHTDFYGVSIACNILELEHFV